MHFFKLIECISLVRFKFIQIDEREVQGIKTNLREQDDQGNFLAGDRRRSMMSSRRSSMSSMGRFKGAGRMGRTGKDTQQGQSAEEQHAQK